jgi:hypothetical protein
MSQPTALEAIRDQIKRRREKEAEAFLVSRLGSGPAFVKDVKLEAKRRRISWAGVRIARHVLGIDSKPTLEGQVCSLKPIL